MTKLLFSTKIISSSRRKPGSSVFGIRKTLDPGSRTPLATLSGMTWLSGAILTLVLVTTQANTTNAGFFVGPGATDSSFLELPLLARPAALAGAFTANSGDVSAIEYNPAGLVNMKKPDVALSFLDHVEDTSLQSFSVGFPFKWTLPNSKKTRNFYGAAQYRLFSEDDDLRNEVGVQQGSFELKDQLFHFSLAFAPKSSFALGASAKIISREIQEESSTNIAFDLGSQFLLSPKHTIGFSVLNLGPSSELKDESSPLPLKFRLGNGYQLKHFLILTDLSLGRDKILEPAGGLEWAPVKMVRVRAGVLYHTTIEFSTGLGLHFTPPGQTATFGLDYAVQTRNELGLSHIVTLKILL